MTLVRMLARYQVIVAEERQRAASVEFALRLIWRVMFLVLVVTWLGCAYHRLTGIVLHLLTHAFER